MPRVRLTIKTHMLAIAAVAGILALLLRDSGGLIAFAPVGLALIWLACRWRRYPLSGL